MTETVIETVGLGKQYRLGTAGQTYKTAREALAQGLASPVRFARRLFRDGAGGGARHRPQFWALDDVNFAVRRGEVVGIIGRNGAGKSTLLKVLSRITEPTTGRVRIRGRVASLLEVGTGFHPELSGRENVLLNGAILGMSRTEITQKFDEIVAFADVSEFVDTPVKHYSSGMYLRLAFSVAAHLEPEILIVDEVLAVGDLAFQEKCLGKMHDVAVGGRTVLFVSHNMAAVKALCSRAILLSHGKVIADGTVHEVMERYTRSESGILQSGAIGESHPRVQGTGEGRFLSAQVHSHEGATSQLLLGQPFRIRAIFRTAVDLSEAAVEIGIVAADETRVTCSSTLDGGARPLRITAGTWQIDLDVKLFLLPRDYSLTLILHRFSGQVLDWVEGVFSFTVLNHAADGPDTYRYWPTLRGYVRPEATWEISRSDGEEPRAKTGGYMPISENWHKSGDLRL